MSLVKLVDETRPIQFLQESRIGEILGICGFCGGNFFTQFVRTILNPSNVG